MLPRPGHGIMDAASRPAKDAGNDAGEVADAGKTADAVRDMQEDWSTGSMTSERQADANRRNALRSTGPRTLQGKEASKYNAVQHGLRAETLVLPDEDPGEFETFRQAMIDELAPTGELEAVLADRIVTVAWRLRRVGRIEAGIFTRHQYQELARRARDRAEGCHQVPYEEMSAVTVRPGQVDEYRKAKQEAERAEALAESVAAPCAAAFEGRANSLANVSRYETTLERGLFKALHELERLQARRHGQAVAPPQVLEVVGLELAGESLQ